MCFCKVNRHFHPADCSSIIFRSFSHPFYPDRSPQRNPLHWKPLKGPPYRLRYFFVRHHACRPVHGSGISPSPRGSRQAALRRKYHCQNSSGHGRSRCKRYRTLKDFPLGHNVIASPYRLTVSAGTYRQIFHSDRQNAAVPQSDCGCM